MSKEPYVIDKPSIRSPLRTGTEVTITALAWLLWVYLLMPLATLVLWGIGIRHVFIEEFRLDGISGLASVAGYYLLGALLIGFILESWSLYNHHRFAGHDRRRQAEPLKDEELGRYFGLDPASLGQARSARLLTVHFEADNRVRLEAGTPDKSA